MDSLRILFVAPYVPSLLRVRPYHFVRQLSQRGHRVTVVAACTSPDEGAAATALRPQCERIATVHVSPALSLWNCVRRWQTGAPLQGLYLTVPAFEAAIEKERHAGGPYDVVHIEHLRAARAGIRIRGAPCVYDSVDCITRLLENAATMAASWSVRVAARLDMRRTARFEGQLSRQFDRILITSEGDRQALVDLGDRYGPVPSGAAAITVVPNGVDLDYFRPTDAPRDAASLVYLGRMRYHANVTAVVHLVRDIMPRIWAQRPEVRLTIVGAEPPAVIRRLAQRHPQRVAVTGYVPDARPFLARATASLSPVVYAAGIQNKVLESMAMGTPVVATAAVCGALRVDHDQQLLIAPAAGQFADQVLRLLGDAALQRRLASNARRYVEVEHDWRTMTARLEDIYRETVRRHRACRQV